ncbi:S9 family peptidase [Erythrobacter crassostreae]|uniref:S9 family peptidase n=1 Tax=Erythrobacter crassostreae TaxID=2828328 RepID=A0A9X1JMZ6_9SPHN|nr:prolyl oligopeptidase family serine peptidase [Erythrobacter crassostrea]MBV7257962.1 S9 family peptidase [Erythrobacter crassostrea]
MTIKRGFRYGSMVATGLWGLCGWPGLTMAEQMPQSEPLRSAPLGPVEFVELPRLSNVSASDDGSYLSYILSEPDWEKDERKETLKVLRCSDGQCGETMLEQLPGKPETGAIWRPGSHQFVVLAETGKNDDEQAYLIDPAANESARITDHAGGIRQVSWLPNGTGLVFEGDTPAEDEFSKKWRIEAFGSDESETLYHLDLATGEARAVFSSAGIIEGYSLSEDEEHLILRQRFDPQIEDRNSAELWRVSLVSGAAQQLTDNRYRENSARLSPDGSSFAFIATVNALGEPYFEDNLFVQSVGDAEPRLLLPDEPLEVLDIAWDKSGEAIWFVGNSGLRSQLYRVRVSDGSLTQITDGDHALRDWLYNPSTGRHLGRFANGAKPGEVYEINPRSGKAEPLSNVYSAALSEVDLPKQRSFSWRAADEQRLEGLLVYPLGYQEGEQYPLVTITHGGPRSSAQFGSWNASRYISVLAGQGYAVFLPNHRGGTGYGDAFMRDMVGNYFRNAHTDVLSGVDALVAEGIADPDRLIKMGWSAGGHMTNKLITVTDRFAVASSGAGVADWVSLYGESDRRSGRTPWFGGTPWKEGAPLSSFRSQSPIFNAWKVTTPTLFWSGKNDVRVPPTQGIMMFRAVRDTGTPTALHLGKGEPHNFKRPRNVLFKINRELAWFAEHLGRPAYKPDLPALEPDTDEAKDTAKP